MAAGMRVASGLVGDSSGAIVNVSSGVERDSEISPNDFGVVHMVRITLSI